MNKNTEEKLRVLNKKIAEAKGENTTKPNSLKGPENANLAWRMVIELVVGMMLGFSIGYGLDYYFNTAPFMILIMSLLGLGAGIKTMMRTSKEVNGKKKAKQN